LACEGRVSRCYFVSSCLLVSCLGCRIKRARFFFFFFPALFAKFPPFRCYHGHSLYVPISLFFCLRFSAWIRSSPVPWGMNRKPSCD
jgi:hypothetical protein